MREGEVWAPRLRASWINLGVVPDTELAWSQGRIPRLGEASCILADLVVAIGSSDLATLCEGGLALQDQLHVVRCADLTGKFAGD